MLGSAWQVVRIVCQTVTLVILARALGAEGFGLFSGFSAIAIVVGGLAGLGAGHVLLQEVARSPDLFARHWSASIRMVAISGVVLSVLFVWGSPTVLRVHVSTEALVALAVAELLLIPLAYTCSSALQANERIGYATAVPAVVALCRLIGSAAFWFVESSRSFESYAWYHLAASAAGASIGVLVVRGILRPSWSPHWYSFRELGRGSAYASSWVSTIAFSEIDKVAAVRYLGASIAGPYGAAYRLIGALTVPVSSLAYALQPRIFRTSKDKSADMTGLIRGIGLICLTYGIVAWLAVAWAAPALPWLLGPQFQDSASIAAQLAPLVAIMSLRIAATSLITALGKPLVRTALEMGAVLVLLMLTTMLAPSRGIDGLLIGVLGTELALALCATIAVAIYVRKTPSMTSDEASHRT